jgi:hypothetical protein
MANRQQVLKKLETLYSLAMRGDHDAITAIATIKRNAAKGDPRSKMALGALALVHQGQTADAERWAAATSLYVGAQKGDARVKPQLAAVLKKAKGGKPEAVDLLSRLQVLHQENRQAITGLGTAKPQLGGYGPPSFHAAGVRFHRPRLVVGAPTQAQLVRLYELMQRALESRPIFQQLITSTASPTQTANVKAAPKPRSFAEAMADQAADRSQAVWTSMIQRSAMPSSRVSSALAGF